MTEGLHLPPRGHIRCIHLLTHASGTQRTPSHSPSPSHNEWQLSVYSGYHIFRSPTCQDRVHHLHTPHLPLPHFSLEPSTNCPPIHLHILLPSW